jgi:hypothetical protein
MTRFHTDPTLNELLGDPVTKAIMKADRVDPQKLEATLRSLAREIAGGSPRIGTGHEMTNFVKTVCLAAILVIAFACVTPDPTAAREDLTCGASLRPQRCLNIQLEEGGPQAGS